MKLQVRDVVSHPVTVVSGLLTSVSVLFQVPFLDALFGVLWTQLAPLFTAVSVFAFTVIPNIDLGGYAFLGEWTQIVAILLAIAYGGKLLADVADKIGDKL